MSSNYHNGKVVNRVNAILRNLLQICCDTKVPLVFINDKDYCINDY